jgi:DNA-binding transcriptional regulator YdaS (Cro superfamily)
MPWQDESSAALRRAIGIVGGQTSLARVLSAANLGGKPLRQSNIRRWMVQGSPPASYCIAIETVCDGQVTRYQLRPDVFGVAPGKPPPQYVALAWRMENPLPSSPRWRR